jgi:hypothetical protein
MRQTSHNEEERSDAQSAAAAEVRLQRLIGAVVAGGLLTATVVAVVVGFSAGHDSSSGTTTGAFGTHYEGLEQRRVAAGVPTMTDSAAGGDHIHPELAVYVRGKQIPIPTNIGIDPSQAPESMAGLHTHDSSGVIHVENAAEPTLAQFFEIWGVAFSADRLGPYEAAGEQRVRVFVDGEPSEAYGDLVLEDGQQVVVAYGTEAQLPPDVAR